MPIFQRLYLVFDRMSDLFLHVKNTIFIRNQIFYFFLKRVNLKMPFDERYKLTIDIVKHFHHMNINGFAVVLNIFLMLNTWCSSKNAVKAV